VGLNGEKDELTARLDETSLKIQGLRTQIAETERRLASSEGDREVLKKELRRMEIIRKGGINFDQKGAMLLQSGIRRNVATNPPPVDGRLNVELKPDGTGRVLAAEPVQK